MLISSSQIVSIGAGGVLNAKKDQFESETQPATELAFLHLQIDTLTIHVHKTQ
jgi:hypothetical protein